MLSLNSHKHGQESIFNSSEDKHSMGIYLAISSISLNAFNAFVLRPFKV